MHQAFEVEKIMLQFVCRTEIITIGFNFFRFVLPTHFALAPPLYGTFPKASKQSNKQTSKPKHYSQSALENNTTCMSIYFVRKFFVKNSKNHFWILAV